MTAVVDTNVVAYHLLKSEPFAREASNFLKQAARLLAPATWEAELANVIWLAVRHGAVAPEVGERRLNDAFDLGIESVPVRELTAGALRRSIDNGVAVYDTLFVELAHQRQVPLVTFDQQVLKIFPKVAREPRAFLREG